MIIRLTREFRLLNRLLTQIARILEVNGLSQLTKAVVEESRASLLPNNVEKKTPNNLERPTLLVLAMSEPDTNSRLREFRVRAICATGRNLRI